MWVLGAFPWCQISYSTALLLFLATSVKAVHVCTAQYAWTHHGWIAAKQPITARSHGFGGDKDPQVNGLLPRSHAIIVATPSWYLFDSPTYLLIRLDCSLNHRPFSVQHCGCSVLAGLPQTKDPIIDFHQILCSFKVRSPFEKAYQDYEVL